MSADHEARIAALEKQVAGMAELLRFLAPTSLKHISQMAHYTKSQQAQILAIQKRISDAFEIVGLIAPPELHEKFQSIAIRDTHLIDQAEGALEFELPQINEDEIKELVNRLLPPEN